LYLNTYLKNQMQIIKIRKGLDIPLDGKPQKTLELNKKTVSVAIKPYDFLGLQPKLLVKTGDKVLAGSPLLYNKLNEKIIITSPISGEVIEIVRGEKRVINEIRIKGDENNSYLQFKESKNLLTKSDKIISLLLKSGVWALIRQRPYDIIPNLDVIPRDIYISTFDTSPLAPDYNYILKDNIKEIQVATDALAILTSGNVHFGINAKEYEHSIFESIKNVEKHYLTGPHPSGNVGVQIHHTKPINKGDIVWYIHVQDLVIIGKLLSVGIYDAKRVIAITGSEVNNPSYIQTYIGTNISELVKVKNTETPLRYISGNVLTGTKIEAQGFLGFYHHQITVIPEGEYYEFLGWAAPGMKKYSFSKLFVSKLIKPKKFKIDTNYHGSERAYVLSGQYEKVFPFDIYPVYLIKAILTEDIDKMEQLGIYEVTPEDFALCDFVCTSKSETQEIVRKGLELLRKEMS